MDMESYQETYFRAETNQIISQWKINQQYFNNYLIFQAKMQNMLTPAFQICGFL